MRGAVALRPMFLSSVGSGMAARGLSGNPGSYDIVFGVKTTFHLQSPVLDMSSRTLPHAIPRVVLLSLLLLAGCSSVPDVTSYLSPHRIDVRQGNYVTQDMVARLKPGMSRDQVRFALGTPLVTDVFHADRWDYVYRFQPGRGEPQLRRLVVFFEEGKLVRVAGDVIAETEETKAAAAAAPTSAARVIDVPSGQKKD